MINLLPTTSTALNFGASSTTLKPELSPYNTYYGRSGEEAPYYNSLYDAWILDSGVDIHVYNDSNRSSYTPTRLANSFNRVDMGKTIY
jgi:hypothetical protein